MNYIEKTIHYCWFGGKPLSDMAQNCIASWKRYCPEYNIVEWNENNFDINFCSYVTEAYEAGKWAFVSDVARLYALVNFGGIYMDTDIELIKSLDELLQYEAVSGFETNERIQTGLMACRQGQAFFKELLDEYQNIHFLNEDGSPDLTTNVTKITNTCLKYGFVPNNTQQVVNGLTILPNEFLCPKDCETGKLHLTKNTICIHHFDGSWRSEERQYVFKMQKIFCKLMPLKAAKYFAVLTATVKFHGFSEGLRKTMSWLKKS